MNYSVKGLFTKKIQTDMNNTGCKKKGNNKIKILMQNHLEVKNSYALKSY